MNIDMKGFAKRILASRLLFVFAILLLLGVIAGSTCVNAQTLFKPLDPNDPKGTNLPPGIPRVVDTNGNVIDLDRRFTTPQYREAAISLMTDEANRVAQDLQLPEELPIVKASLTEAVITPFGFNYLKKGIGSVSTKNFIYYVTKNNRFNEVNVANYDEVCTTLEIQKVPVKQLDLDGAYRLSTQWLAAASMDVEGLNRDCKAHVAVSPKWNDLAQLGQKPRKQFTPIYYVWWSSSQNDAEGHGSVASVELFSPTKTLLQLSVADPKYILRKPVVFTNLSSLFPGTAPVVVFTNHVITGSVVSDGDFGPKHRRRNR